MSPSELLAALRWRYATKNFDPTKTLDPEAWDSLLSALVLTPSSFGLQPWKFIVVDDPKLRAKLRECSWDQPQVTDAARLIVFATRTNLTDEDVQRWAARLAEIQKSSPETLARLSGIIQGFCESMSPETRHAWNARQTYIALGQFMTSAAILGIDTCPLEGLDPKGYDLILGLEGTGYSTLVACAAGHRSLDDLSASRPKARFPRTEIIEHR